MEGRQIQIPTLSYFNKILIILLVGSFILSSILQKMLDITPGYYLGLSAERFFSGHIYTLFTYPLISGGIIEVVVHCLMLWLIGSEMETMWGISRYFKFLMVATIGSGVLFLLINLIFLRETAIFRLPLFGVMGFINSLFLAYAILFPNRPFYFFGIFPILAKYFCAIVIAMELYHGFFSTGHIQAWGHIGGPIIAFLYMWALSHPRFKQMFSGKGSSFKKKPNFKSSHLRLVDDDDDPDKPGKGPKYYQ